MSSTPAKSGVVSPDPASPAWWDARYRSGDIPWDTGIVPPEVQEFVASAGEHLVETIGEQRWALDLGCGSGLNSRYLASHNYRVVGLDLAVSALLRATREAQSQLLPAYFCLADVGDLSFLAVRAQLALDVGCFHALPMARRTAYISSLAAHLHSQAFLLMYAFEPQVQFAENAGEGPQGVGPDDIAGFAPHFALRWAQHGQDRTRPSAWYLLQRTACP